MILSILFQLDFVQMSALFCVYIYQLRIQNAFFIVVAILEIQNSKWGLFVYVLLVLLKRLQLNEKTQQKYFFLDFFFFFFIHFKFEWKKEIA